MNWPGGAGDTGEVISENTVLGIPAFWRCVSVIAGTLASCPVLVYKNPGKKQQYTPLLDYQNQAMTYTQFELWELAITHLATWGNAYVLKVRGDGPDGPGTGVITDLKPIHPSRVMPRMVDGVKMFEITRLNGGLPDPTAPPVVMSGFDIMHIAGFGVSGFAGMSPLSLASRTFGTQIAADKLAARFYRSGTILSGIINVKQPLAKQEQADAIRNRWISRSGGVSHAAEVAVLDAESSFQPLTIEPEAMQFLQSRQWQSEEIARLMGVPPHMVGDVSKSTSYGTGIDSQAQGFIDYTLSAYTNRIEQRISREVVTTRNWYAEFDLNRLLRGDMEDRSAYYAQGIQWGWLTRNEARARENLQPIDGLDVPLTPLNMAATQSDAEPMGTTTPPGTGTEPADDSETDPE